MIIDIHTHIFPDKIASKAIAKLSESSDVKPQSDGTLEGLKMDMKKRGIDRCVLMPVVTNPGQIRSITDYSIRVNQEALEKGTGVYSFSGIHPDNENYKEIINELKNAGIKGIKVHPVFQNTYFDDLRYMRIVEYAMEKDMFILTHAGYDISYPGLDFVTPEHIIPVLKSIKPHKLILAHMGAWGCWDMLEEMRDICPFYVDTAFSICSFKQILSMERFREIVRLLGSDHILFGSDSPWTDQRENVRLIENSGLEKEEIDSILFSNAVRLLQL